MPAPVLEPTARPATRLVLACSCGSSGTPRLAASSSPAGPLLVTCVACGEEVAIADLVDLPGPVPAATSAPAHSPDPILEHHFALVRDAIASPTHDAFVDRCYRRGRLDLAAACYQPLLRDPIRRRHAERALKQIALLAQMPMARPAIDGGAAYGRRVGRFAALAAVLLLMVAAAGRIIERTAQEIAQQRAQDRSGGALAPHPGGPEREKQARVSPPSGPPGTSAPSPRRARPAL